MASDDVIENETSTQRLIGYVLDVRQPDKRARCTLSMTAHHLNRHNVLHGGIATTMLASAMGAIASLSVEGGYFCTGGDLGLLATRRDMPRDQRLARIEELHDVIRAVLNCPKPVIAAVEGGAAGAGVSLAFACDMIVADRDATFTVAYVKAGLVPDGGLTSTLASHLPRELVMRMALLREPVTAERLFSLEAISQIEPAGNVVPATLALADRLGAGPSGTQGRIKALVNSAHTSSQLDQMNAERDAMADAIAAAEAAEGITAFLEKRRPDFTKVRGTS